MDHPFKRGDRVRLSADYRVPTMRGMEGTVDHVHDDKPGTRGCVDVILDRLPSLKWVVWMPSHLVPSCAP